MAELDQKFIEGIKRRLKKYTQAMPSGCIEWIAGKNPAGYGVMGTWPKTTLAHRAAWMAVNGQIENGLHVCHHCDNPSCCNPDHLFLGTPADNCADKMRKGRWKQGAKNPRRGSDAPQSKLTEAQVREIFLATGPQKQIAARYGIVQQTVSDIKLGRRWRHLERDNGLSQQPH